MDFRDIKEFFRDASKYIIIIIVMLLIVLFVASFEQVIGPSMYPTLKEGNVILVNKLSTKFGTFKRNEIIVLKHDDKHMIKRIIGLPGEHIEYKNNTLYINGEAYKEKFLEESQISKDYDTGVIPDGKYFVLGDNRVNSLDGKDFGLIDKSEIIGKAWIRIWPLNKFKLIN